jgi:dihydropteroate synthase
MRFRAVFILPSGFIAFADQYNKQIMRKQQEFDLPLLLGTSRKYFLAGVSKVSILNFTERDITGASVSSKHSGKAFHFFVFMKSSRDVS